MAELIDWRPVAQIPEHSRRCLVHAINQWFIIAVFDAETQQFWDKDNQPVVGVIEWSYRDDRSEV
jgi:hypothetical protein